MYDTCIVVAQDKQAELVQYLFFVEIHVQYAPGQTKPSDYCTAPYCVYSSLTFMLH